MDECNSNQAVAATSCHAENAYGHEEPVRSNEHSGCYRNHVAVLLDLISTLSTLASFDSSAYQESIRDNEKDPGDQVSAAELIRSIEKKQEEWKLEETSALKLTRSIQRLHSNVTTLQAEVERQQAEIDALTSRLDKSNGDKRRLNRFATRLCRTNAALQDKLKQNRAERSKLVQHVRVFEEKARVSEQQQNDLIKANEIYRVRAHEHNLQDIKKKVTPTPRIRLESDDTNFSDMDALDFYRQNSSRSLAATSTTVVDSDVPLSSFEEEDMTSVQSDSQASSISSLVTDDGIATIRFALSEGEDEHPTLVLDESERSTRRSAFRRQDREQQQGITVIATTPSLASIVPYTLSFPRGTRMGIKIRPIPIPECPPKHPRGLITDAVMADIEDPTLPSSPRSHQDVSKTEQQSGFNPLALLGLGEAKKNEQETSSLSSYQVPHAFIVCGFLNFDTKHNPVKPQVGARIIAINGERVNERWTMTDFRARLQGAGDPSGTTTSLTFRNEPLTPSQLEIVSMSSEDFHERNQRAAADAENSRSLSPARTPRRRKMT